MLSTQQRSFQDKVRARRDELANQTYQLSQALKEYESDDALRFDRVPLHGREIALKFEIDGRVAHNPNAHVAIRVLSPFQRALDPQVGEDAALRQRSAQDPDNIFFRMAEVSGLRGTLALALATAEIADGVINSTQSSGLTLDVARQAKQVDLASHKKELRRLLAQSVRGGVVFFRGTIYQLAPADSSGEAVRATLGEVLPSIYSRFAEVPHRVANEEAAVKAALHNQIANHDLKALGVYRADGTLNESHPLLSALRGRLPLAEQDQGAINADALRAEFERPPFGWDGNCIKVGLALLLRASACRLIESGRTLTDPSDPDCLALLTREQRFKALRVQGVRADLSVPELQQIRGYVEAIFGVKPPLVAATLNNTLGEKLAELAARAKTLQDWAKTAQCPLPTEFESGAGMLAELVGSTTPMVRLPRFLSEANILLQFAQLLDTLTDFQRDHAVRFLAVRDFYTSMLYADVDLPELSRFLDDWRTVAHESSVTDPSRWNELVKAYHAAQQAVDEQVVTWQEAARKKLVQTESGLAERVRAVGVPEDQVTAHVTVLDGMLQSVRERLAQPTPTFAQMRGILTTLANVELKLQLKVQEIREQYLTHVQPNDVTAGETNDKDTERRLRWRDIAGRSRITCASELDSVLDKMRAAVHAELVQYKVVIID